ncbi:MAG: hypothetical protein NVS3B29_07860 [Candidatus Saccharimonadales bacterium]
MIESKKDNVVGRRLAGYLILVLNIIVFFAWATPLGPSYVVNCEATAPSTQLYGEIAHITAYSQCLKSTENNHNALGWIALALAVTGVYLIGANSARKQNTATQ